MSRSLTCSLMTSASEYIKEALMKLIIISKSTFNMIELSSVSAIVFGADTFTVTASGTPHTYAYADYNIQFIW